MIDLWRILQVAFGIGLVIFVHEAGHFLAARWCKVHVQVFSLGFGPALFAFRRGGTRYQIALVPLGGYVKMAGDEPTAEGRAWARAEDARSVTAGGLDTKQEYHGGDLHSKSIGQRFFIFSGGVLMNLAFGAIVFPILFARGVPFVEPLIRPELGRSAWRAGLEPGSRVLAVDGEPVFDFFHIPTAVALGNPNRVVLRVLAPGATEPEEVLLVPDRDEMQGLNSIGVLEATDRENRIEVEPGSPAFMAGLRSGMRLLGAEGTAPGQDPIGQLIEAIERGGTMRIRVADGDEVTTVSVVPAPGEERSEPRLGIRVPTNYVRALRENQDVTSLGLEAGDVILSVNGTPIFRRGDFARAVVESEEPLRVEVLRRSRVLHLETSPLDGARALAFARAIAVTPHSETTQVVVTPGWAAHEAGLRDGDVIRRIDGSEVSSWDDVLDAVELAGSKEQPMRLAIERPATQPGAQALTLEVVATPRSEPILEYGIASRRAEYVYRTTGPLQAFEVGLLCSWKFVEDTWLTLKRMVSGQVSSKNIGGIITISRVSYSWSEQGPVKLLFFLCMLSINLAILNVLPIPVLDGGHLMFLLIEKVKGSPPSDRFLGYSQMVGLVFILSLMVYVTYNDIVRLFPRLFDR